MALRFGRLCTLLVTFLVTADLWAATVSYDGNGGTSGTAPDSGVTESDEVVVDAPNGLRKTVEGRLFGFTYWNTAADGSGDIYAPGDTLTTLIDVTLYAIYRENTWANWSASPDHNRTLNNTFPAFAVNQLLYRYAYADSNAPLSGTLVIDETGTERTFNFFGESLGTTPSGDIGGTCINGNKTVDGNVLSCGALWTNSSVTPLGSYVDGTFITALDRASGSADNIATAGYGTVDDAPSDAPSQYAIIFDAPVKDLVLTIWSLGRANNDDPAEGQWKFDQPWAFVQQERDCSLVTPPYTVVNNGECTRKLAGAENTLSGFEGDASIIFYGENSEISWEITAKEVYAAFTFGVSAVSYSEANNIVTVTAGDASSNVGEAIATITSQSTGLIGEDTLDGVSCTAYTDRSYTTLVTTETPPGTYITRCTGGSINDVSPATTYVIGYVNGTYTITAAPDADSDTIPDAVDNCPNTANTDQADLDDDGLGDLCDDDFDGDGIPNAQDLYGSDPTSPFIQIEGDNPGNCTVDIPATKLSLVGADANTAPGDPINNKLSFALNCDVGATATVRAFFGEPLPPNPAAYKIVEGIWTLVDGAVFDTSNQTVVYQITDGQALDLNGLVDGRIEDPVTVVSLSSTAVPLPIWLLALLGIGIGTIGGLYRPKPQ
jgi:hypothetical protein